MSLNSAAPAWSADFQKKLNEWRNNPVLFVREALNAKPAKWQIEALQAIHDGDRVAIRSGHGVGKSAYVAWLTLWWILTHFPAKVAITANRADQLRDVVWAEIRLWHRQLTPALANLLEIGTDRVHWKAAPEECFAVARTARKENPEAFQGFHSKWMLFIADESSGIDDIVFEVGQGAMSTPGAKTVLTGNPTRNSGYFYNAFHKSAERWWKRKVSVHELIGQKAPYANPDYPQEVADEYGLESNRYRYRVLGEFALEEDDVVIPLSLIEAAEMRDVAPTGEIVWGVDVARFGDDASALCKRRGNTLMGKVESWRHKELTQSAGIVRRHWDATTKALRPQEILVDSIGYGAGVLDILKEMGLPARGVNVGETASADDKFVRLRDELWWKAREWFDARDCSMPQDDGLKSELVGPKYDFTSAGKILVESKDEMKKRGLKSPNKGDAFCLTFGGRRTRANYRKKLRYPQFKLSPFT